MDQKQQTQKYFDAFASDWQSKSVGEKDDYNIIAARNNVVLSILRQMAGVRRFLDMGCGTGQLVLEAARLGLQSTGVDFAVEMIAQCEANRASSGLEADFVTASALDYQAADGAYDVISAQGFIEYVDPDEMEEFFRRARRMLGNGGALIVGSRNRLFNMVSLNRFTQLELELGSYQILVSEAIALHQSSSLAEVFEVARSLERIDPQPAQHPLTGIDVTNRCQYSPAELIGRLRKHGFVPHGLFPVHFHGLPISLMNENLGIHVRLATAMAEIASTDYRIVPYCSTFLLDVRVAS
jgi:SAM-dependent methyltransferase